ncbi:MAG: hypoxanthine phosphoribosyltransferase [Dactylosporangium sp.]|nr:hypoxanthine phosphoribosyltransferase [Dactylosporangium sp.]
MTGGSSQENRPAAIAEVLIDADRIAGRVRELAREIDADYAGRSLKLVCILKGAVPFAADLMRAITLPCKLDFVAVSSYGSSTRTSGVVRLLKDLEHPIDGEDVLIVEDIVDTGLTLKYLRENLRARGPRSLAVAALLDKHERRAADVDVEYVGFPIPDRFVVGYGLDYDEQFRNLPYVGVLRPEALGEEGA